MTRLPQVWALALWLVLPLPHALAEQAASACRDHVEVPADGGKTVSLNSADEDALLDLPGIGPARAKAILAFRASHGGFRSIAQLLQIKGIGRSLLKRLRPLVTL